MIELSLPIREIEDRIHIKDYYIGESFKKKDIDATIVQSSIDEMDEISTYVDTAMDEVVGMMQKRVNDATYNYMDEQYKVTFTPKGSCSVMLQDLLRRAIIDYCVQYAVYLWLLHVKPELAAAIGSILPDLLVKIEKYLNMINDNVRRRYTVFGI